MKQLKLQSLIFLTAICLLAVESNAQKLVLKKGQKIQLNNTMKSVTNMELMGQSMEMTSDAYLENQVEVKDKKTASYLIGSKFTKMVVSGSAMGQNFSYDSDKKEDRENEIGKKVSGFLDKENQIEIKEDGKVVENASDSANRNETADAMSSIAGGVDFTKLAAEAFVVLPAGVKPGYAWSDSIIADGVKTYRNYTLNEIKNNVASITVTGTQVTNKTVQQMGAEVQVTLNSKLSGDMKVDTATGFVLERNLVSDGNGTAEAMGQSIPLTNKITSNSVLKTL